MAATFLGSKPCELPASALLRRYSESGAYADCYAAELPGAISRPMYVEAFYTTWLFKLERAILRWAVRRPSTDIQARQLAQGTLQSFAAWRVEGQDATQILLGDFSGRTKSWLMVATIGGEGTRLYFGSAVVPVARTSDGKRSMGWVFHALLGFHRLYARLLLHAACARVRKAQAAQSA
ncbi:hypothetical protein [uncultured Ramlibacter sp.]|uniref:hypothetical protein n=1 Tax=uncultured Ramlibacter sp. TaxID=260755 RepID=UPI00262FDCD6|nr:hypothetical protein [uncultured Ramlibacter sp.]